MSPRGRGTADRGLLSNEALESFAFLYTEVCMHLVTRDAFT